MEKKQDAKYGAQVSDLRTELEQLMKKRLELSEKTIDGKQQVVLDLMGDLEKKMDHRSSEVLDDLRSEVSRLFDDRGQRFEQNFERVLNLTRQVEEKLDAKNVDLLESFATLKREVEKLINERTRQLEILGQSSHSRALELMVELEKKIDKTSRGQIENVTTQLLQQIEEVKTLSGETSQSTYKKLLENMIDLEKRTA